MKNILSWLQSHQNKTAVFIAHRLSTISDCDLIYVLNEGKVLEQGTHEELMQQNGMYAEMWKSQSKAHP